MRVFVDLLFIVPGRNRGTQTYVDSLLIELDRISSVELVCVTNKLNHKHYTGLGLTCRRSCVHGGNRLLRLIYQQLCLPFLVRVQKADILFCPGYLSPILPVLPVVPVVHDMNYRNPLRTNTNKLDNSFL